MSCGFRIQAELLVAYIAVRVWGRIACQLFAFAPVDFHAFLAFFWGGGGCHRAVLYTSCYNQSNTVTELAFDRFFFSGRRKGGGGGMGDVTYS